MVQNTTTPLYILFFILYFLFRYLINQAYFHRVIATRRANPELNKEQAEQAVLENSGRIFRFIKQRSILTFLIIFVIFLIVNFITFGPSDIGYTTPAYTTNITDDVELHLKTEIVTLFFPEKRALTFYISKTNDLCVVKSKKYPHGWVGAVFRSNSLKNLDLSTIEPFEETTKSKLYPKVLYGVTKSPKINTLKVNGNPVKVQKIKYLNDHLFFWYYLGGSDLEKANLTYES